jgi:undecaprenyl-diphosphatase
MTATQALILGVIQGITEFLPISSSGHLVFVPKLLGWVDQGLAFDVFVHMGTLLAVIIYFRKKLHDIVISRKDSKLGLFLLLSVVPAAVIGFLFGDWIVLNTRSTAVVGASLIFWGLFLAGADGFAKGIETKKQKNKKTIQPEAGQPLAEKQLNWKDVLFISCAQAIALIPGTSRSGITMTAGMFSKLDKKSAAEFSFLMSIPVIALAGAYKVSQLVNVGLMGQMDNLLIGFFAAMISGFLAINLLMKIIERWSFMPFVVYRIVIGVMVLVYL